MGHDQTKNTPGDIELIFTAASFHNCHFETFCSFLFMFFLAAILKILAPKCHSCF